MGTGSKVCSLILRFGELCSSAIVTALLGRFFYLLLLGPDDSVNGRLIYAEVISCLAIAFSIILMPPLKYSFYAWPIDIVFFICSLVAFGLLADLNGDCSSRWYYNYWGYNWGRYWNVAPRGSVTVNTIDNAGCSSWRTILAFLFLGAMAWFLSAILGIFVFLELRAGRETHRTSAVKERVMRKRQRVADPETQQYIRTEGEK